jgi:uncharacterized membrane protein YgcG
MEQRRLRLGDITDDYCPRERRVTNHAIVAIVEDDIKQTRCTTCDAEHAYKGGRAPKRRKKDSTSELYREVLAGMPETDTPEIVATPDTPVLAQPAATQEAAAPPPEVADSVGLEPPAASEAPEDEPEPPSDEPVAPAEDGPIHRRLIRATLPRPEGQKVERQEPDFTIRAHNAFRDRMRSNGNGNNGHQGNRGGRRFAGGGSPAGGGRGSGRPGFGPNSGGQGRPSQRPGRNRRRPR